MKTLALTIVCTLFLCGSVFAQGTVFWSVFTFSTISAQTNSTLASPFFGGGPTGGGAVGSMATSSKFYFTLLYNTSFNGTQIATPSFATLFDGTSWLDTGLMATNSTSVAGRLVAVNANTAATVPWANGITNNIMLVGWSGNLGNTWSAASTALTTGSYLNLLEPSFFGVSATGYINPFTSNPGASVFGSGPQASGLPINSPNMQLYIVVPEPSTIALAGLGGLALAYFRRRKRG